MHPRICAGLLTAVVVLTIGCSQSPVAPSRTPDAMPAVTATLPDTLDALPAAATRSSVTHRHDVPFAGVVTGEAVFDFATNPKHCASTFTTITTAKGQVTHTGLTTWQSQHCLGGESQILDAELVLTAANGDQISATYTGSCGGSGVIGEPVTCSGNAVISGGTGRFEHATGTARWKAAIVFQGFEDFSWPGRWEWEGTITY